MKRSKLNWLDPAVRLAVLNRDGWRCQRCGSAGPLHVHHLLPRSRGGPDETENLLTLCFRCHSEIHGGGPSNERRGQRRPGG